MAQEPLPRQFTVDEYHRLADAGILTEDDRVELIEGIIVQMPPIGSRHAWCVARLTHDLAEKVGKLALVWPQNPIRLGDDSEPQPDLALVERRDSLRADQNPSPADVILLIEVGDSSAGYDRSVKSRLYAAAGVPEYWIVDLDGDRIDVLLESREDGYRLVRTYRRGEAVSPQRFPKATLDVSYILGEPRESR